MIGLLRRLRRPSPSIDDDLWQRVRAATPWVAALDGGRAERLRTLAARFLHQKAITPLAGLSLDDAQRAQLAALCCLPLLAQIARRGVIPRPRLLVGASASRPAG